jgi:hypothetical protein
MGFSFYETNLHGTQKQGSGLQFKPAYSKEIMLISACLYHYGDPETAKL